MRLAFLGDVVGRPGRRAVGRVLPRLVAEEQVHFVVANAENASGGRGIAPDGAEELYDAGIDVLTTGNHVWRVTGIVPYMREEKRLLRPQNFARDSPGRGWTVRRARGVEGAVGVINLIGRVFMGPSDCPFRAVEDVLDVIRRETRVIVVDMHGEASSEKMGMARFLDGRVSAVLGSHTHVQTADEGVLAGGTAYITDAGMCGPEDSILGMKPEPVLRRFLTQMPARFEVATGRATVQGVLVDVDEATGRATGIRRIRERVAS